MSVPFQITGNGLNMRRCLIFKGKGSSSGAVIEWSEAAKGRGVRIPKWATEITILSLNLEQTGFSQLGQRRARLRSYCFPDTDRPLQ